MTHKELQMLADATAPVIAGAIERATAPLEARIAKLEKQVGKMKKAAKANRKDAA